ncbi:uncharacterized protein LOC132033706 [Lycium ferocissimum]|uniref:uncharacterized protein LOC132033706 n=1 Tax=Lycium ferocissimum TaxID=112874 RepID=UPI002815EB23|nr:uncharacterized protein LOC132033706 [Lycium ferocissimum]
MTTESNSTSETVGSTSNTLDPFHPLYLHPSDTPRSLLVSIPFSGEGCGEWKEGMIISLSAKNKIQIIDGSFTQPAANSPLLPHWLRCNNRVKAWIMNALTKDIAKTILYYKTAKEAWDNLADRYGVANMSQYYTLQRAISSTFQGS